MTWLTSYRSMRRELRTVRAELDRAEGRLDDLERAARYILRESRNVTGQLGPVGESLIDLIRHELRAALGDDKERGTFFSEGATP